MSLKGLLRNTIKRAVVSWQDSAGVLDFYNVGPYIAQDLTAQKAHPIGKIQDPKGIEEALTFFSSCHHCSKIKKGRE